MIKNYNKFNEGINQFLKGPSKKEVWDSIKDLSSYKLLKFSCENNILRGVKLAIQKGINIHINDDDMLRLAGNNNSYDVVKYLLENYTFTDYTLKLVYDYYSYGKVMTLINKYLTKTNEGITQFLKGPSKEETWNDIKDMEPEKIFIVSCKSGILKGIEKALEQGVDINAYDNHTDDDSEFGINYLIEYNHNDILKVLLERYADEMKLEIYLEYAVYRGKLEAVKLLLEYGAKINDERYSILIVAVSKSNKEERYNIIKCLLDHGADKHIANDFAIKIAEKDGDTKVIELLKQYK